MAITKKEIDEIEITQKYREVYKTESVFGGIIKYERLVKRDRVGGEELHITTTSEPESIFLNGMRIL